MSAVLKLVQPQQFTEQVDVDLDSSSRSSHSLQSALSYLSLWQPTVVRHLVERFSAKGETVLDVHCSAGSTGIDALALGRHYIGCSSEHALVKLASARINPADLAEVVLRLQFMNLKRPVDVRSFQAPWPLYFDVDTYCELMNVKSALRGSQDRVDIFMSFVVATILHGHTVGHLSGYSSPQQGLAPEAQAALNRKRGEVPSYRAVSARVIKKAATLLRDGIPSNVLDRALERSVLFAEPNALDGVKTGSADLALLCPEQPGAVDHGLRSWLRSWWLGVDLPAARQESGSVEAWQDGMSEQLLETARAVRRGGRAVVRVLSGRIGSRPVQFKDPLTRVLKECLPGYWQVEGTIIEHYAKASGLLRGGADRSPGVAAELVVLRRK
jgi:hypothetical protein